MTKKVRTTLQPDVELEVDDIEYTDLLRQGLLVGEKKNPEYGIQRPGAQPAAEVKEK